MRLAQKMRRPAAAVLLVVGLAVATTACDVKIDTVCVTKCKRPQL